MFVIHIHIYSTQTLTTIAKMFRVGFNSNRCTGCDQPHWCPICFSYEHNARNHTKKPLEDTTKREMKWFFGYWADPLLMKYEYLWYERPKKK